MEFAPLAILEKARRAVPAVNFALGVAGVAAAAAIVSALVGANKAGLILLGSVFVGMVLLLVFSTLINSKSMSNKLAGEVLVWAVITFFVTLLVFTTTAIAAGWPCNWAEIINVKSNCNRQVSAECQRARKRLQEVGQEITNFIGDQCILASRIITYVKNPTPANWTTVRSKATGYTDTVSKIDKMMRGEALVYNSMPRDDYKDFLELLDIKNAISTSVQLETEVPPPADGGLGELAKRLRTLAKSANAETKSIGELPIAGCPAVATISSPSGATACREEE